MSGNKSKKLKHQKFWLSRLWYVSLSLITIFSVLWMGAAQAQVSASDEADWLPTIWMTIAAMLVFFMNAGFAMLEAGFCRTKNATNVLAKNLIVFCVSALAFWLCGFGLMFGDSGDKSLFGQAGFVFDIFFPDATNSQPFPNGFTQLQQTWGGYSFTALFFFQLAFAGTAATIVSGAVAERIKFWAFILFTFCLVGFSYPLTGHWVWGNNSWLANALDFQDFAGSTVVHSVGGTAGLIGALLLKPRDGRFGYNRSEDRFEDEQPEIFAADNLGFATLGCLILWLGWFGFNGGSTISIAYVPHIITTTMMAAASGGIGAIFFSPIIVGKPRLVSIINGILGGLVGITASSAYVNIYAAIIIGLVSGFVVLIGESLLEVLKLDDPVGAVPVHLFCGFWGTLAVGLFSSSSSAEYDGLDNIFIQTLHQFLGWLVVVSMTAIFSLIVWILIGIILHYLDRFNERLSGRKNRKKENISTQNIGQWIIENCQIGRNGIRVSEADEKLGSDGVFYNSKKNYF